MLNILVFNSIVSWLKLNAWWLLIVIGLLIILISIIIFFKKPKVIKTQPVDDELINEFIQCYGGIDNIKTAELDSRRLKVSLIKIDKVNIDELKNLGASGIFISGNNIKMVLPYDMEKLVEKINKDLVEA